MRIKATVVSLMLCLLADPSPAQEMPVPVDLQLSLFLKIVTFNRSLKPQPDGKLRLGVVYQGLFRASLLTREQIEAGCRDLADKDGAGLLIEVVPLDIHGRKIEEVLVAGQVDLLYIAPLRAYDIGEICRLTRRMRILSLTGVPEYSSLGVAVAIGKRKDMPQIIINLPAARAEGADFSSQLLKLARIVD